MTSLQLCRAVAGATGESLRAVRRLGFQPMHRCPARGDLALAVRCPFCRAAVPLPPGPPSDASCAGCGVAFDYDPGEVRLARRPDNPRAPRRADLARLV